MILTVGNTPDGGGGLFLGSISVGCVENVNCGVWL